ncbi:hypothetical protein SPRG_20181 [Saprolegnia parasitica CBS 223.65]|uniref:Uncharacterized protein n=1 Tax=Saprolegnia parasitica (strain CBS 223.65) TaxID=695850 RepID=A0A067CB66_SAPPC|nr:hypothetical protein SPRG_20181 [Saprolegnia parasitica CBS 223.65]KDO28019.1 hypothetical protein SPRG_20181 [Saprolegnia parasitica CBS 223.65]|eukprot:XP_012201175.1 hypothetical protein SPRG_20181 [Saprolegnia parasitica CBS 223.65]
MAEVAKPVRRRFAKPEGVPVRDSMAHFVSTVRLLDSWWKDQEAAKPPTVHDSNSPFVKSSAARSTDPNELIQFVAESELQIEFLMRMPSIERCLLEWWTYAAHGNPTISVAKLSSLYESLATVLIRCKKPNLHKSAVRTLMHRPWIQWSGKLSPLAMCDFQRLIFLLAHMIVETEKLPDYVTCLTTTLRQVQGLRVGAEMAQEKITQRRQTRTNRRSEHKASLPTLSSRRTSLSSAPSSFSVAVAVAGTGLHRRERSPDKVRKLESSQVVVSDLSLLTPAFAPKFRRSEPIARSPYLGPLHIQSLRGMNQRAESAPDLIQSSPAAMPVQSLDDIERLVAQCTAALPTIETHASVLRRNVARPPVLDRLLGQS